MSDPMDATVGQTLADQIAALVSERTEGGEYTTVRSAAKKLNVKQTDIKDNLPAGAALSIPTDGTLGNSQILLKAEGDGSEDEEEAIEQDIAESNEVREQVAKMLPKRKERVKKVETEKVVALDEEGNPIPEAEKVVCAVCGNVVRKSSIVRRGICPLCFRQLAKNVGMNATKLEALSDEEFEATLGEELGRRRSQEERKLERTLSEEQFKEMKDNLIPVKELFAAGKAQGYGPGRVAQAVGGDRFRHEPVLGYGSVWTPYFYGARNAWYFDKDILNHWDDLKKPEKVKKEKSASGKTAGVGRKGARGAAMTPIMEVDGADSYEDQGDLAEMEETEAGV